MPNKCPYCDGEQAGIGKDSCGLLMSAFILAGLAMMLNIRLSYSSAPYALIRFRLPENLFSVFVRRMASALELWCLPSMLLGNIMDLLQKLVVYPDSLKTEATSLSNKAGTLSGHADTLYGAITGAEDAKAKAQALVTALKDAASKGDTNNGLKELLDQLSRASFLELVDKANAAKDKYEGFGGVQSAYKEVKKDSTASTPSQFGQVKSAFDALHTAFRNAICTPKFNWIIIPSIISQWLNFLTYVILLVVYLMGGDQGHLTTFYFVIAISGVVFGINMTLVYSVDWNYIPVYIVGENSFPIVTSFMHYLTTLMFGNRRKWNSDFLIVNIDIVVAIIISFVAAVVWTVAYGQFVDNSETSGDYHHIFAYGFDGKLNWYQISPFLMIVIGMGLVYAIYPGIAPGMIVPFYLIDKIEMVLLIATFFPPIIVATLQLVKATKKYSPKSVYSPSESGMGGWKPYEAPEWEDGGGTVPNWFWHFFDILFIIKIILAAIFIYSLHYRDSNISRSIVNQPKMSTTLSILFYMCHEFLLAIGFPGFIGNNGGDLVLIPQYIGALFMIFLAFYSEGYIIEYKIHDHIHWPTEGMTKCKALFISYICRLSHWVDCFPSCYYYDKV